MSPKIGFLPRAVRTHRAGVSLLSRVCPKVPLEVGAAVGAVEALLAAVQLLERVHWDVPREVLHCAEGPWA